jgi:hypothetical protein
MRAVLLTLLALALPGCGSDYADRLQILDAQKPETVEALSRLRDLTLAPFDEWVSEAPVSCNSHNLENARTSVLLTAGLVRPDQYGFPAAYDAAEWILEVADAAASRGCTTVARDLYLRVNSIYTGSGYVRLRDHALTSAQELGPG